MRHQRGFTLVEVMVVVTIVAILTAIALPAYNDYVLRSKLQEATSNLLTMRVKVEQFYQDQRTYIGACANNTVAPLPTGLKYFNITCPTLNAAGYTIQAQGTDSSVSGFTFTIDQGNVRKTTSVPYGWTAPSGDCWVMRKNGSC
jgi:type IV pilus assembly protein PilE